ncbi:hypothetical protein A2872_00400 [Candidatus Gottesmanbacteria bacterium RIFCSPHIGHO2_01_FULL_42_12]|uniref:DUF624 domain-containing protein n=1 Tax=Candidatus Gottesmanbacteria bacterium RIFCSPHIGHO2_01_FULL_42_12 TaxID=1798377 RepID=A0A1F5Z388_9BACT|nr:MAG: hypothetical protein A2872_00400 [Candidatus Gottesmanbacteria bacterium RIFCSPHIGHO2_01_FULL_42_12]
MYKYFVSGFKRLGVFPQILILPLVMELANLTNNILITVPIVIIFTVTTFVFTKAAFLYPESNNYDWMLGFRQLFKRSFFPLVVMYGVLVLLALLSFVGLNIFGIDAASGIKTATFFVTLAGFAVNVLAVFHAVYFAVEDKGFFESYILSAKEFRNHGAFMLLAGLLLLFPRILHQFFDPAKLLYPFFTLLILSSAVAYYKEKIKNNGR